MAKFPFTHKVHRRARNLKLRVLSNGEVQVTSPRWTPKWAVSKFVDENTAWIEKQLAKQPKRIKSDQIPSSVLLFGKKYQFKIKFSTSRPVGLHISGQHLIFNPTDPDQIDGKWHPAQQKKLDRFLKTTAAAYIMPRTQKLAKKMRLKYGRVALKQQSSRWGSCSSKNNLNFNWRLVHCPPEIIDYVIIHELSHLEEMNHSAAFWSLVEKYDPGYKLHRGWLKRNGDSLLPY